MITFKRGSLPIELKFNKRIYVRGDKTNDSIAVEVEDRNFKGKLDLHGKPYEPSIFYYNPK